MFGWIVFVLPLLVGGAIAQPPGTAPPANIIGQDADEESEGLPIRAFMFLSDSKNPVIMPSLTWKQFERLLDRDAGIDADRQSFSFESLEITGATDQMRAVMEVVLRVTIEPTGGRWISIPLRMGNFHRIAPPDISGIDEHFMTLAPGGAGHLLFAKTNSRQRVMLRMRVSASVEAGSSLRSLAFRLPDTPSRVELTTDSDNVSCEVVGRGDEVITPPQVVDGRRTRFVVDSGGGTFSLRWGRLARSSNNQPQLEVDGRIRLIWDSPQDQPIAKVGLKIENLRGSVESFQLRLPSGSIVMDRAQLGTNGPTIELGAVDSDGDSDVREVVIPKEERQQRIDLNFDLQLANEDASPTSPLGFRVPEVVGALRHAGQIEVETSGDYRLRWRATGWIQGELGQLRDDGSSGRGYRFRYTRASFDLPELPLWLSEKERQLRMISSSEVTVRPSTASLEMSIQVDGQTSDGRLHFDDQAWRLSSIENAETGDTLDSYQAQAYRVIEYTSSGSQEPVSIRIRAERPIEGEVDEIRLPLPRVLALDDSALVRSARVDVASSGRRVMVVDLEASTGLIRVVPTAEANPNSPVTSFRVLSQDTPAIIVGTMIDRPPRIILESDATIELDGDQLRTTVDWNIRSTNDLEGRLPIRIPKRPSLAPVEDVELGINDLTGLAQVQEAEAEADRSTIEDWVVTVDEFPAVLEPSATGDDRCTLVSPRLAAGDTKIRWRHVRAWRGGTTDGATDSISMPRPASADVTVRGQMRVSLRGNSQLDLVVPNRGTTATLMLDKLPRDPIRLKLQSRTTRREELSIRQTVLRTAVGRNTRQEQLLVTVQGGDTFRVGLPSTAREVSVEAYIDGESADVRRDRDTLLLTLPGDEAAHVIDLSVWVATDTRSTFAMVKPILKLPVGVGRMYWQIVAPTDGHVVWASPTLGRSMAWRFEGWKLYRKPTYGDEALTRTLAPAGNSLPPGNRYLYIGSDLRSFQVIVVSRAVLWMCMGSIVLLTSVVLTNFPRSRHPMTAVVMAVLFAGLLAIAPDAAVLAGQVGIIALVLVVVMVAIRALITPGPSDRIFTSSSSKRATAPSTRSLKKPESPKESAGGTTQPLPVTSAPEAAS